MAALPVLACCARTPPPPSVSLAGRACSAEINLQSAQALVVADDKPIKLTFDEKSACVESASAKYIYSAFALPRFSTPYILYVTSTPQGDGLFSPVLRMLDAQGKEVRAIPRDAFSFHGTSLHVALRAHPDEAFLIVSSDPDTVGQNVSRVVEGIQTYTAVAGPIVYSLHNGVDSSPTFTYSHNGLVTVTAQPIPKAD